MVSQCIRLTAFGYFSSALKKEYQTFEGIQDVNTSCFREKWKRLPIH